MEYVANEVNLDQEFSLSPGQSTMIKGENLVIKFIEVISDGRCPRGPFASDREKQTTIWGSLP
jgi:hypothetical protein